MNKTVILVAHDNYHEACNNMFKTADAFRKETGVCCKLTALNCSKRYTLNTDHCTVHFVTPRTILDGIRADAIFADGWALDILKMHGTYDVEINPSTDLIHYISHIELVNACIMFPDGVVTCKKSDEVLVEEVKKVIHEEVRKKIFLYYGRGNAKSTLSAVDIANIIDEAEKNGVLKGRDKFLYEPKLMDIDEWSKMPPYLAQQQIYITTARGGGRNWYYDRWQNFMDELEKEPKVKPLSRKEEETMNYIKQDVETVEFLWKEFHTPSDKLPEIKNVIFNDPATIVMWEDGTKTVVQCQEGDIYDPEKGLAMAISKKIMGNKRDYYHTFKHWLKKYKKEEE